MTQINNNNKIIFNNERNFLEEEPHCYNLQNRDKPNLYREIFSYDMVPLTAFNHRYTMPSMPKEIYITDTTFRDGQQSREPYSVKQIVDLFKMINELGGKNGVIRQSEFFAYSKKDVEAIYKCRELGFEFPEITTWIRANKKDFNVVKSLEIKETGILISCSDYHIYNKMKLTREEAFNKYVEIVRDALNEGIIPRCHLEDITRADFYGFVVPLVNEFMNMSKEAKLPVKIRICDTLGIGASMPGVTLPRSVPGIVYGLKNFSNVPSEWLEWHGHNDFYRAVINGITAWMYGASAVNCSLLGIGERTGNIPTEAMVMEYASLRGTFNGMNPQVITDIADYYTKELKYDIPPMTPFVGENFNVTKAGIHADGLNKDEEIYNIFDTKKILNREVGVAINQSSGIAGIVYWYNKRYPDEKVSKESEIVLEIKKWIDNEYDNGRQHAITNSELEDLIKRIKG